MKYVLFVIFWISLQAVSPKCRPNEDFNQPQDLHLTAKITAKLTDESQKNLQMLVKNKLVENRQIPETASINIESIYLDKRAEQLSVAEFVELTNSIEIALNK